MERPKLTVVEFLKKENKTLIDLLHEEKLDFAHVAIANGADITVTDVNGNTPLHYACMRERVNSYPGPLKQMASLLLAHGANPNARNCTGQTPLFYTTDHDLIREFITAGADVTIKDCNGEDALMYSLRLHRPEDSLAHQLLNFHNFDPAPFDCPFDPAAFDCEGYTVLHRLCMNGEHVQVILKALQRGANPNAISKNDRKTTPLHIAEKRNYLMQGAISLLISYGADSSIRDGNGKTPFDIHVNHLREQKLLEHARYNQVGNSRSLAARFLLETSGNALTKAKKDALKVACRSLHEEFVQLLLEHNVEIPTGKCSWNPLHSLAESTPEFSFPEYRTRTLLEKNEQKARAIARLILDKGAQINGRIQVTGRTPLQVAVHEKNTAVIRVLLELGADQNIQDYQGRTPLLINTHELFHAQNQIPVLEEIISILLNYGADPNRQDSSGKTLLHYTRENINLTSMLLEHGADPNIQDEKEVTPLSHTESADRCHLLLEAGARIDLVNPDILNICDKLRLTYIAKLNKCIEDKSLDQIKQMIDNGAWAMYSPGLIFDCLHRAQNDSDFQAKLLQTMLTHPMPGPYTINKEWIHAQKEAFLSLFVCDHIKKEYGIHIPKDIRRKIYLMIIPSASTFIGLVPTRELHKYTYLYGNTCLLQALVDKHTNRIQDLLAGKIRGDQTLGDIITAELKNKLNHSIQLLIEAQELIRKSYEKLLHQ